jgi:hypothetical protein
MMWLSPKLWAGIALALVLAASHWFMYGAGKNAIQVKWDADVSKRIQDALAAEQAARAKEKALAAERHELEKRYADEKRKAAAAAAGAKSELDRLRREIAAAGGPGAADSATAGGAHGAAAFPELLGACAGALFDLGQEADRIKGIASGLQDYAKNVCKN